jgi:phospholipid/cholesterol/gamma-HCH transport system permease protein
MASATPINSPNPPAPSPFSVRRLGTALMAWIADWQRVFMFGAMACVMMVSSGTYDAANRASIARQVHLTTLRILPWFTLLAGLVSWVLVRVVLVTALHYGLAKFALDLMVKVLVLEVIPLFAALYVATRNALSTRGGASGIFIPKDLDGLGGAETDRIRDELVPRVIAYAFSVMTMVVVSGFITLLLAYLSIYGLSRWGLPEFERTVGQAFDAVATLSFIIKMVFYGLAVAVIPIAASLNTSAASLESASRLAPGTARLLMTLFVIEGLSLAVRFL